MVELVVVVVVDDWVSVVVSVLVEVSVTERAVVVGGRLWVVVVVPIRVVVTGDAVTVLVVGDATVLVQVMYSFPFLVVYVQ